ncbi:MAG TPA: hypothetical protein VKS79_05230 [Gemmataceae bacterium]|nr:hypothetical protein [Gemmataceae bacterium]
MACLRFLMVAVLALVILDNLSQFAGAQEPVEVAPKCVAKGAAASCASDNATVTSVYSLWKMGYDLELSKWIAETIPEVIEPSTWQSMGGSGVVRYNSANGILVVRHCAAIHSKVENFLKDLKQSLPATGTGATPMTQKMPSESVVPAAHHAPSLLRPSAPPQDECSSAAANSKKSPKHVLHLTIHYEGEGIIDDNVVKYFKSEMDCNRSYNSPACAPVPAPLCTDGGPITARSAKTPEATSLPSEAVEVAPAPMKVKEDAKDADKEKKD